VPAQVAGLQPATRAIGIGIFYTVYHASMMRGRHPRRMRRRGRAAFDFGATAIVSCSFNRIPVPVPRVT